MWYNSPIKPYRRVHQAVAALGFCLFICGPLSAKAEDRRVVGDITFQGHKQVKLRTLKSAIKLRKGDVLTEGLIQEDIRRLYDLGWFDDVSADTLDLPEENWVKGKPSVRIAFTLRERPAIKRIDFKGHQKISTGKLREKLGLKDSEPYDRSKANQDVQALLELYRDEGFVDARVEHYTSEDPERGTVLLTFFITEGQKVTVRSVEFTGNSEISDRKLCRQMKTRRRKTYKEEVLQQDLGALGDFYREKGFLDAVVSPPSIKSDEDKTSISIAIAIVEGSRYTVGDFSFGGHTIFTDGKLREAVTLKPRRAFRQSRLDESVRKIQELYADRGYLRTEVTPVPERKPDEGLVNYHFSVVESSVVYVDGIYIDGNSYTKEFVIRREVLVKPGDIFAANKIRRSVEKIYNLGFLDDVQVDVQQPRTPELADVVFTVKEGKPGILSAGAGYSSVDGLLGTMQVQHINLFGRAQRLNLLWEFGARRRNYEISWTDPWFLGKRMLGGVDLFNLTRQRPVASEISAYTEERRGGAFRLGPRVSETLSLLFTYSYADVHVTDVSQTARDAGVVPSRDQISSVIPEIIHDTRDNVFDASRGARNALSTQLAGGPLGGTVDFYKPTASSAWFFPTFWKFVLSASVRAGLVQEFGRSTRVPDSERFLIGGVDSVRGYNPGEVGPQNGGKMMGLFNAEYKFPIVQESGRTILQGALFYDIGGAWAKGEDIRLQTGTGRNDFKAGAGFGIRFKTPVFPIRLDYGWGFHHGPGESTTQFYFTIGNIF